MVDQRVMSQMQSPSRQIVAYLSHSYRPEDRLLNMVVWRRLNDSNLIFLVDPPSDDRNAHDRRPMDVTFIERMMVRSDCFVAIVPDRSRPNPDVPGWSPYQELECRIAIRAGKPMLVVAERNIDPGPPDEGSIVYFTRAERGILFDDSKFDDAVTRLRLEADSRFHSAKSFPPIGILQWNPPHSDWVRLSDALRPQLPHKPKILSVDASTPDHEILNAARATSVVLVDVNPHVTPPHIVGLLHGAAVPMLRTCLVEQGIIIQDLERELGLSKSSSQNVTNGAVPPPLLHRYRLDTAMTPVRFWNGCGAVDAAESIKQAISGYREREKELDTPGNGVEYFLSLLGNRVFISTPGTLESHSVKVADELNQAGFPAFHYKRSEMPVGDDWAKLLQGQIKRSDLVVALISDDFWRSGPCVDELAQAIDDWERHEVLLQIYLSSPIPRLPGFLGLYQAGHIDDPAMTATRVVNDTRARFARGDQIAIVGDDLDRLEKIVARHFTDRGTRDTLVNTCKLAVRDAEVFEADMSKGGLPARSLLNALVQEVRTQRFGGSLLGRLILELKGLELDLESRRWLKGLAARWRLFPGLHDIRAWKQRQERHVQPLTFSEGEHLPAGAYRIVSTVVGETTGWFPAVTETGRELAKHVKADCLKAIVAEADCRVCATVATDNIAVPLDWILLDGLQSIARTRPMYRQVTGLLGAKARLSIEEQFDRGEISPPRVLIFGYASRELPQVTLEVENIRALFEDAYRNRGWPTENIRCVSGADATKAGFEDRVQNSDYDLVHLAGHAGLCEDTPALRVAESDGSSWIRAEELGRCLRTSSASFVYLNCCTSAAPTLKGKESLGIQETLCLQVLQAGVPEVVGYLWPVADDKARGFALSFYQIFLRCFDAAVALHGARSSCPPDNPLWAASVLIKQPAAAS